jgi:hypothetical protein
MRHCHRHIVLALCLIAVPAAAADMPQRKPGLWELKMNFAKGVPPQIMQQCTDAQSEKLMNSASGPAVQEVCSKRDISNSGGKMTIDSVCAVGGKNVISHIVVTGSFDSSYVMDINTSSDGPLAPGEMRELNMTMEGKYLGACTADQKPGDMIMPGGVKLNVLDIQKRMQSGGGAAPTR